MRGPHGHLIVVYSKGDLFIRIEHFFFLSILSLDTNWSSPRFHKDVGYVTRYILESRGRDVRIILYKLLLLLLLLVVRLNS
jgi:hypothetical protein